MTQRAEVKRRSVEKRRGEIAVEGLRREFFTAADLARFESKFEKLVDGCWLWTGSISSVGYGVFHWRVDQRLAHRLSYWWYVGDIAEGLTLDHLCEVRHCVNPAHLDPVTIGVNTLRSSKAITAINARKTHCKWGHEFTPENTRAQGERKRACRACDRERGKR